MSVYDEVQSLGTDILFEAQELQHLPMTDSRTDKNAHVFELSRTWNLLQHNNSCTKLQNMIWWQFSNGPLSIPNKALHQSFSTLCSHISGQF